jgi:cohesin complex subunit SCC1
VEEIMRPSHAPFALRLSSQLMIGVVRIHQRKTRYLLDDCNEAMMKIKLVRWMRACTKNNAKIA